MAALAGEFAIIMLVSGEPEVLARLLDARHGLSERTGLTIFIRRKTADDAGDREPRTVAAVLTASCMDHPGVVHRLTAALAEKGVNIDSMETRTESAPWSGAPIFQFEARLAVPVGLDLGGLRDELFAIARERNIDISLEKEVRKR
jgi:glycine cleavage system transcriptional repressor